MLFRSGVFPGVGWEKDVNNDERGVLGEAITSSDEVVNGALRV